MPVIINKSTDYQIGAAKNLKLFSQKKTKKNSSTDDFLNEAKVRMDSITLTDKDLKFIDTLKAERELTLTDKKMVEKANKSVDVSTGEKESKSMDTSTLDIFKIEKELRQDLKKIQKRANEKEAKLNVEVNKKVNKVAPLNAEKFEEKQKPVDKKPKDEPDAKLLLSDRQFRHEDMKKVSFSQDNVQKYALITDEIKKSPFVVSKNKENDKDSKNFSKIGKTGEKLDIKNAKDSSNSTKTNELNPPLGVSKNKQNRAQDQSDEKLLMKKVMDRQIGKTIEKPFKENKMKLASEKESANKAGNGKKFLKYTDTGLSTLRRKKRNGVVEPTAVESEPEPEPVVEESKKKKKGTNPKPFSFEAREKECLKKKEMLAKMGEERTYEVKKWARSPKILKKKPFSIHKPKRYIIPYTLKLNTEERIKKRPKFDVIVEQKQKFLKEQQLMKRMADVKALRKTLVHSPTPIPESIMRLLKDAKKMKNETFSEMSDSDQDLFCDLDCGDTEDHIADGGSSNILNDSKHQNDHKLATFSEVLTENFVTDVINNHQFSTTYDDELKQNFQITGSTAESNVGNEFKKSLNNGNGRKTPTLSSEESVTDEPKEGNTQIEDATQTNVDINQNSSEKDENPHGDIKQSNDAPISNAPTTKLTPFNLLITAFRKTYSS